MRMACSARSVSSPKPNHDLFPSLIGSLVGYLGFVRVTGFLLVRTDGKSSTKSFRKAFKKFYVVAAKELLSIKKGQNSNQRCPNLDRTSDPGPLHATYSVSCASSASVNGCDLFS